MKPHIHAKNSVKKYGGRIEDYMPIHEAIDSSKSSHATVKHRAVLHSAFGIYLIERIFGATFSNSDGKTVSVRDVAEDHVIEDLGRIPSLDEYLNAMKIESWMGGPSRKKHFVKID
jgi:uncharacterized protein related to proFAR isomerase